MWLDTRLITDTSTDFQSLSLETRAIEIDKHLRNVTPDESPSRDQMVRPLHRMKPRTPNKHSVKLLGVI